MAIDRAALKRITKGDPEAMIQCKRKFLVEVDRALSAKDAEISRLLQQLQTDETEETFSEKFDRGLNKMMDNFLRKLP